MTSEMISLRDFIEMRIASLEQHIAHAFAAHTQVHTTLGEQITVALDAHEEHHRLMQHMEAEAARLHEDRHHSLNRAREEIQDNQSTFVSQVEYKSGIASLCGLMEHVRSDMEALKLAHSKQMGGATMAASIFTGGLVVLGLIVTVAFQIWK